MALTQKERNLEVLVETGVVAVIRAQSSGELLDVVRAIEAGGVRAIEITMTTPNAIDVIKDVSRELGSKVVVGVGTVLDAETARMAILAGAEFVVSPVFKQEIISMAKRYSKIVIPGGFTPTEILAAWEAGADVVKVFPATKLGPEFFKDMKGPFPQILLTPTGGVDLSTAGAFIKAGASFLGVGTALTDKKMIAEKRWDDLAAHARKFIDEVARARA
ncbi:MAG: bifunctional 4-hydroxy-2-oxoglutarate aldolase/2-dehydro-3-deoxy-phosphogluconate aldolase [Firmicutes bacterium]|jgi:2-dehydro-3-deoxyphosphogluconate aldolase/(4S)-4-hydroxy-2-oxoglutarate aldolase|nr:bifunctional 4-hydroxy-2-oxoglutarate aldolase/2-dehydro-3-deoxy-phosphogluconate aldolase [Bacillota bacterium]